MNLPTTASNDVEPDDWQRLSLWSIVHYITRSFLRMVNNLYALIPLAYGVTRLEFSGAIWILVMIVALIVVEAYLRYVYFGYQILADAIQVNQGIFFKKHINLAFRRIQNINIEYPFYFRPMGLVTLKIDGAGSAGEEVYLSALTVETAQRIRKQIQRKRAEVRADETLSERAGAGEHVDGEGIYGNDGAESEEVFYTRATADLIIHGLSNNRAWIILGGLSVFYGQFSQQIGVYIESLGIDVADIVSNQTALALIVVSFVSFMIAIVIVAVLSVMGAIFTYHGFTLNRSENSLTVRRGLFTRHELHVQKSRVQTIYLREDWLDKVLGRMNLMYEQISHLPFVFNTNKLVVPSVYSHETKQLINEVFPLTEIAALTFTPSKKTYFYKVAILWSFVYVLAAVIMMLIRPDWFLNAVLLGIPCSLHVFLLYMAWKRRGLAIQDDLIVVRSGVIGTDYVIFPANKIQEVTIKQSPLMRRGYTATLVFTIASRSVTVPHIDQGFARDAFDYGLYCVESSSSSWM